MIETLESIERLTWQIEQLQQEKQQICTQQGPNLSGVRVQESGTPDQTAKAAAEISDLDMEIVHLRGELLDSLILALPYIDSFPEDFRRVLIGRYILGWSVRHVAEVVRIPKSTVYQMLKDKKTEGS